MNPNTTRTLTVVGRSIENVTPQAVNPLPPSWGRVKHQSWTAFVKKRAQVRDEDPVTLFAREAWGDRSFPEDPCVVVSYLASRFASSETLRLARLLVSEYRRHVDAQVDAWVRDVAYTSASRGEELRRSLEESRKITDRRHALDGQGEGPA